ncbi:MAG: LytTR family DNA-binding domain-containing protein [Bacteroidota bacterium]
MIKAIAIDTNAEQLEALKKLCEASQQIKLMRVYTDYFKARKYVRKFPVDIVFVDIALCISEGKKLINSDVQKLSFIFTSNNAQHAATAFELNAVDFLVHPIAPKRFQQAEDKAMLHLTTTFNTDFAKDELLYFRVDGTLRKVHPSEVLYVQALGDYVIVHIKNRTKFISKATMKWMTEKLNPKEFIRINRAYIISIKHLDAVKHSKAVIGDVELPIGETYRESFRKFLKKFNFKDKL